MNDLTEQELKELKDKAQAWDIAWPALIFMDAMGEFDGSIAWKQTMKQAVKFYNQSGRSE